MSIQILMQYNHLQLPSNIHKSSPPLHPQLHVQPNPNPDNKVVQQVETPILPTYCISHVECNEIQLCFERVDNTREVVTVGDTASTTLTFDNTSDVTVIIDVTLTMRPITTISNETSLHPPYHERLIEVNNTPRPESDFSKKLKNLHV